MASRILRPLEYGDILDELFDLYKSNFLLFVKIAGIIYLPATILLYAIGGTLVGPYLCMFLLWPLFYIIQAAMTYAVSQAYLGNQVTFKEAYGVIKGRFWSFSWTMLLTSLIISAGFVLCFVPGIIFGLMFAFVSAVFVIEGQSGKAARRRSNFLAKDQLGRIFVITLITGIITGVVSSALSTPFNLLAGSGQIDPKQVPTSPNTSPLEVLSAMLFAMNKTGLPAILMGFGQGLAYALTAPISVIATILLYYDLRVRKEGFDIEMLANSMGVSVPQQPVSPYAAPSAPTQSFTPGSYNPETTDQDSNPYQQ